MLSVFWEIIIPILLAFAIGLFIGWLLWRWRRTRVSNTQWRTTVDRAEGSERLLHMVTDERDKLEKRFGVLETELKSSRTKLAKSQKHSKGVDAKLAKSEEDLSVALKRVGELLPELLKEQDRIAELEAAAKKAKSQTGQSDADLAAAASKVSAAEGKLADANGRVSDLESQLTDAHGRVANLEGQLAEANDRAASVEGELAGAQTEIQGLASISGDLDSANADKGRFESDLTAANALVGGLQIELVDATGRIGDLEAELAAANNRAGELEGQVAGANDRAKNLQGELADANGRVEELESTLAGTQTEIQGFAALSGDLESARAETARVQSELSAATDRVQKLEGELADANGRAGDLEGQLAGANDRTQSLEGNLSGARGEIEHLNGVARDLEQARKSAEAQQAKIDALEAELAKDCGHTAIIEGLNKQLAEEKASNPATSWQQGTTKLGTPGSDHTDDLKKISGIGPKMEQLLNGYGITSWEQLAYLTDEEVATVDGALKEFPGRIRRDEWVPQAKAFLAAGHTPVDWSRPAAKPSWQKGVTKLGTPGVGHTDDLKVINGVGPKMESILNRFGITAWEQLAAFTKSDIELVSAVLETFPDRVERDAWVAQAKELIKKFPEPNDRPTRVTFLNQVAS